MSDFSASAELSIEVPDSELTNARQQIESAIGTTELGVTDGGSMSAQSTGGGGRQRRRARRSYRMAQERTSLLEDAVVYLEEIEDGIAEEGSGGIGILDEVAGAIVETGGDVALEFSDALVDVFTGTISSALGYTIANAINGSSVGIEEPKWAPISVEKPNWAPIGVEDPPTPGSEDRGTPIGVDPASESDDGKTGPNGALTVEKPSWTPLDVDDPSPLGVDDPSPLSVESEPIPVEDVGPVDVNVNVNTGERTTRQPRNGNDTSNGGRTFWDAIHEDAPLTETREWTADQTKQFLRDRNANVPDSPIFGQNSSRSGSRGPGGGGGGSAGGRDASITVDNSPRTTVTVEPRVDSIVDDVVDAIESQYDRELEEIRSELADVQRQFENIEREVRRSQP